jgi:hypothetical protein
MPQGLQQMLDEELAPLRDSVAVLEARLVQDEASLRAALLKWADEGGLLRAEVEGLRKESESREAYVRRLNEEQILVVNQFLTRISTLHGALAQQGERLQGLANRVQVATLAGTVIVAALVALFLLR